MLRNDLYNLFLLFAHFHSQQKSTETVLNLVQFCDFNS